VQRIQSTFITTATALIVCCVLFSPVASADVTGSLGIGTPGTVTVTNNTISWTAGVGGYDFSVNSGTTLTFDSPSTILCSGQAAAPCLGQQTEGNLAMLTAGSLPMTPFMSFLNNAQVNASDLKFYLAPTAQGPGIGPGSSNNGAGSCSAGLVLLGLEPCSISATSPFILENTYSTVTMMITGVTITLPVNGIATDNTGHISDWFGSFSETFTSCPNSGVCTSGAPTAAEIQSYFNANPTTASITSTYSGTFQATVVATPEPSTLGMLGIGFGLILVAARRRRISR